MVAELDIEKHHRKVETVAKVAGVTAVIGQCILTETPWGVGQLNGAGFQMTADTVDFVYGMVVGSLAATAVGLVANEPTPNFDD